MKKILALLLALVLVFALAACGAKQEPKADSKPETKVTDNPDEIPDNMTSSDGKYEIAFVTDVGQLKDKSFNQGTYDGVKLYANNNSISYKYYQPANGDKATDDEAIETSKNLARLEGIMCGISSGTNVAAAIKLAAKLGPGKTVVTVLPDTAERYFSTPLFDD